jgi:hypothetical protein
MSHGGAGWLVPTSASDGSISLSKVPEMLKMLLCLSVLCGAVVAGPNAALPSSRPVAQQVPLEFAGQFQALCEAACSQLNKPGRTVPFYQDAYVVRSLLVEYDRTRDSRYLEACKTWADRMLDFQRGMVPKHAYYMNYGRKPGEAKGLWYVADTSCIGLAVLSTGIRCPAPQERRRYVESAELFANMVLQDYVGPKGGIKNGAWPKYEGVWWCSTGTFGAMLFTLYGQTGKPEYLRAGTKVIEWLNAIDLNTVTPYPLKEQGPSLIMYVMEAYSAAWGYLDSFPEIRSKAVQQAGNAVDWMLKNRPSKGEAHSWGCTTQWGSKFGGLPEHTYVYARVIGDKPGLAAAADAELRYVASLIKDPKSGIPQLGLFAMISYAERLQPGAAYRIDKPAPASGRAD